MRKFFILYSCTLHLHVLVVKGSNYTIERTKFKALYTCGGKEPQNHSLYDKVIIVLFKTFY